MLAQLSRRVAAAFQSPIVLQLGAEERFQLMSELQSSQADDFDELPADVRDIVTRAEAEFNSLTAAVHDDKRDGVLPFHLPGRHSQKSHGNRVGRENNVPSKSSKIAPLDARDDSPTTDDSVSPAGKRVLDFVNDDDKKPLPRDEANGYTNAYLNPNFSPKDREKFRNAAESERADDAMDPEFIQSPKAKAWLPIINVDPSELVQTQRWLREIDLDQEVSAEEGDREAIIVYRANDGTRYLTNGHHRINLALAKGLKNIEVREATSTVDVPTIKSPRRHNPRNTSLTAAARADKRDGAMIALIPTQHDLERLALDGYEPPEDLHLTLFYLGDADKITPTQINELVTSLMQLLANEYTDEPVLAKAFGVAHWNPESDDPAWVLNVGDEKPAEDGDTPRGRTDGLADVRHLVEHALADLRINYPPQHSPWQPHICIAYSKDDLYGELASRLGPLTFDVLRVAWGEYDIDIRLVEQVTASATAETFHLPGKHNQKSHGNRKSKGTAKGSNSSTDGKSKSSSENTKSSTSPKKSFNERVANAKTGNEALTSAPIHNRKTLDAMTTEERPAYPGARYNVEEDVPLNGVPGDKVREAVSDYSGNGYQNINWALRVSGGDDDAIPDTHPTKPGIYSAKRAKEGITGVDAAMKASPLENDVVVYRGIANPNLTFGDAWQADGDNSGLTYVDNAYVSTTVDQNVARTFASSGAGVHMNILVPKGKNAIGIEQGADSGLSHEKELLLDRKYTYRINRDYIENGVRTLDVEVVR